ncbi:translation initiation factor [Zobellella maritima]|uniref:translation initiation factor n=1 Tax=Zobellella maritima TaxID=2059725 RepID=UPI000E3049BA|nr:stress response translation initiation inhibitor YciH [Zobellella maritima]
MTKLVYSTDPDWQSGQGASSHTTHASPYPDDGILRIRRETKGRKGAGVVCIYGLPADRLKDTASLLKKQLGTGGAIKQGVVEIQGDRLEQVKNLLENAGFQVKKVGG